MNIIKNLKNKKKIKDEIKDFQIFSKKINKNNKDSFIDDESISNNSDINHSKIDIISISSGENNFDKIILKYKKNNSEDNNEII